MSRNLTRRNICRISLTRRLAEPYQSDPDRWADEMLAWIEQTHDREQYSKGPLHYLSWETNYDQAWEASRHNFWVAFPWLHDHWTALTKRRLDMMRLGVVHCGRIRWDYVSDPTRVPWDHLSWVHVEDFWGAAEHDYECTELVTGYDDRLPELYDSIPEPWQGMMRDQYMPRPYVTGVRPPELRANACHPNFRQTHVHYVDMLEWMLPALEAQALYTEHKTFCHEVEWSRDGTETVPWGYPTRPGQRLNGPIPVPDPASDPGEFSQRMREVHRHFWPAHQIVSGYTQFDGNCPVAPTDYDLAGELWPGTRPYKAARYDGWPGQPKREKR